MSYSRHIGRILLGKRGLHFLNQQAIGACSTEILVVTHETQQHPTVTERLPWENALWLSVEILLKEREELGQKQIIRVMLRPGSGDRDFLLSQRSQPFGPYPTHLVLSTTNVNLHTLSFHENRFPGHDL